jgi:hypothetical protein
MQKMKGINCFLPWGEPSVWDELAGELMASRLVRSVYLYGKNLPDRLPEGCKALSTDGRFSTGTMRKIAGFTGEADYTLLVTRESRITFGLFAFERYLQVAEETGAGLLYSDFHDILDGKRSAHPVIDYQAGSLRDDFEFGPVLFFSGEALRNAADSAVEQFHHAGLYQIRLKVSRELLPQRIQESLYSAEVMDTRTSGKKMFDYVDPGNREVQVEMEQAVTTHLKEVGAYLEPRFSEIQFDGEEFETEASVIIPVLNRVRTIQDAVESVMAQKTGFSFNLILVDNHSTDGTTDLVKKLAQKYPTLIHVIPERRDLGIGGCWNVGVHHPHCGKFAVQLDSDDLYSGEDTLERMVHTFYEQQCAMVVGSYRMTNFDLEEIPPGVIDHREWTPDNGRNNALRINGLGAPRAFYTPLLRRIQIPNVSYGEDYAVGLAISRHHRIGRIYESIYLCRRWEDNSDASLNVEALNRHNLYKDRLRSFELSARIKLNQAL